MKTNGLRELSVSFIPDDHLDRFTEEQRESLFKLVRGSNSERKSIFAINALNAMLSMKQYGDGYYNLANEPKLLAGVCEIAIPATLGLLAATSLKSLSLTLRLSIGMSATLISSALIRLSRIDSGVAYAASMANALKEDEFRHNISYADAELLRRRSSRVPSHHNCKS